MENAKIEVDKCNYDQSDQNKYLTSNLEKNVLILNLNKFEGPIDVLLDLAKRQKVDLKDISIIDLVEQYLSFINKAKKLNLELATDYLVMAAWLAYLKSKLLIPVSEEENLSGEDLSEALAFQLRRLNSMREAATKMLNLNLLYRDRFVRGMPEGERAKISFEDNTSLNDLLLAYTSVLRSKSVDEKYNPSYKKLESVEAALIRLNKMIGDNKEWKQLSMFLPGHLINDDKIYNCSVLASTFSASLELVKTGTIELQQEKAFGTIMIRKK
jgi:segregation and condensation protein A